MSREKFISKNCGNEHLPRAAGAESERDTLVQTEAPRTVADAAVAYAPRGWKLVPVSRKTKKAIGKKWQKPPFDARRFNGQWSPLVEFADGASAARKAFQEQALAAIHTVAQESVR